MSNICPGILPLEYQEAGDESLALPPALSQSASEDAIPVVVGVPEDEVERRIQIAREVAITEADQRIRIECEHASKSVHEKVAEVLQKFDGERTRYFRRVEGEVVQLALAIARKILQREAEVDPTLLIALVRVALDRMQCGSCVRVRVPIENADLWRRSAELNTGGTSWEIVVDESLNAGDCIVETELGTADFGFEAQLRDVEESFAQLLAHRPTSQSRHAAGA